MHIATSEWTADWLWSLPLIAFTLVFHAFGLIIIGVAVLRGVYNRMAGKTDLSAIRLGAGAAVLIAAIGLTLAILHGLEAGLWAVVYIGLGAFSTMGDAMLFSLDSMTTRGASGLSAVAHWRLMGALEAACGVLTFGASTAFLFSVLQGVWQALRIALRLRELPGEWK